MDRLSVGQHGRERCEGREEGVVRAARGIVKRRWPSRPGCDFLSQCRDGPPALARARNVAAVMDPAGPLPLCWALVLVAATACSGGSETPSDQLEPGETIAISALHGAANGRVTLDGDALIEGRNTFLVDLSPPETDLSRASALMPSHGHGSPTPANITRTTTGYRVSNLVFSMPGLWNVLLDVDVAGRQDRIEFSVDIP